jgi:Spy/CpxP family protein refolding chaperone
MLRLPLACVSLAVGVVLVAGQAFAQRGDNPPSGERGQRMGRGMMEPGGNVLGLLRMEKVQKELKLSDEQKEKIGELAKEMRPGRPADGDSLTPEERRAKMDELRKKAREKVEKRLAEILKPEQLERMKQIHVQAMGAAALGNSDVVKALGITDDQRGKLKTLRDEAGEKGRELFGSMRDLSPEEQKAKMSENHKKMREIAGELMEKSLAVLTPEQREKFEKMKGKKFDMDFSAPQPPRERPARRRID